MVYPTCVPGVGTELRAPRQRPASRSCWPRAIRLDRTTTRPGRRNRRRGTRKGRGGQAIQKIRSRKARGGGSSATMTESAGTTVLAANQDLVSAARIAAGAGAGFGCHQRLLPQAGVSPSVPKVPAFRRTVIPGRSGDGPITQARGTCGSSSVTNRIFRANQADSVEGSHARTRPPA